MDIKWREASRQFVILRNILRQIQHDGASRILRLRNAPSSLTEERLCNDLDHITNLRFEKIVRLNGGRDLQINLNSVCAALFARTCLRSRAYYKVCKIEFGVDECSQALPDPSSGIGGIGGIGGGGGPSQRQRKKQQQQEHRQEQQLQQQQQQRRANRFDALLADDGGEEGGQDSDEETVSNSTFTLGADDDNDDDEDDDDDVTSVGGGSNWADTMSLAESTADGGADLGNYWGQ